MNRQTYMLDRRQPFVLHQAIIVSSILFPAMLFGAPRDVQFRTIDIEAGTIELFNFGTSAEDLSGWRFCTHDENEVRRYSPRSGLNGISLGPGESLVIHFNDDAPAQGNALNVSSLGGFAGPLDGGPYAIQLYFPPVSFGNGNAIADHVQWSMGGTDNSSADERSDEAEAGGVWLDQSQWVVITPDTLRIELNDLTGSVLHGPNSYTAILESLPMLQAGDADEDLDFDQLDLVQVQIAAKYLTGQAANWGEGDWNGAPGGSPGSPPPGDGVFNQFDIIAAQIAANYLSGPYAAVQPGGVEGDGQTSLVYNANTGELAVDAPAGTDLTSINIDSAAEVFTGDPARNLGGSFDNDADGNIFKATFGSSFGSLSFGNVAQPGLSEDFVLNDLTVVGSLAGGGDLGNVDLIYVPEPSALALLTLGLLRLVAYGRRRDTARLALSN